MRTEETGKGIVLLLTPTRSDAAVAARVLEKVGVITKVCSTIVDLALEFNDSTDALVIAAEALVFERQRVLLDALAQQPPWSDVPIIVLTSSAESECIRQRALEVFGPNANVTSLERPLHATTLVSSIQVAARARQRQRQVRDLIEEREAILFGISDAFSALDRDWRYTFVNDKVAELAGVPKNEMIGRVIWEIFPDAIGGEFYERCHKAIATQRPDHFEVFYKPWKRWLDTRIYPTQSGLVIFRADITSRKNAGLALQQAKQEAEEANRAKDHFLAMLSHELRTPLTPVLMTIKSLQGDPSISTELRRDLQMLQRNIELESLLIDDLLDLTRISHGKLQLHHEAVDIHTSLEHAIGIASAEIGAKNLEVTRHFRAIEHHSWADATRLQQVFWNLIKNATKFTAAGGSIKIRTRNDKAHHILIEVADDGAGIAPEVQPKIFDAFEQGGRGTTSKHGGLGLGLAISKRVVDLHGGTISVMSLGQGLGATFTVKLKAMETSPLEGPARPLRIASAKSSRAKILLVEDHLDTAHVLSRLLQRAGHKVKHAATVGEGDNLAANCEFDLVISDVGLPDGSGLDLMSRLRERYGLSGIALSGFGMDQDRAASKAAGFAEHLTKPVDVDRLRNAIERLMSSNDFAKR